MDLIPIKKTKANKGGQELEVFIVPAISMQSSGGNAKKIPHPAGHDTLVFKSLEKAIEAINLAGFGYSIDDKQVPASEIPKYVSADLSVTLEPLIALLKDENQGAVASAAYALGELRCFEAIKPLIDVLGEDDPIIRKNATEALAKIGEQSIRALIEALDNSNWVVRNSAAVALGEMAFYKIPKVVSSINPLAKRLEDNNWIVRSSAATAIGKISSFIRQYYQQ